MQWRKETLARGSLASTVEPRKTLPGSAELSAVDDGRWASTGALA